MPPRPDARDGPRPRDDAGAPLQIVGDLTILACIEMDDWTPAVLTGVVAKLAISAVLASFGLPPSLPSADQLELIEAIAMEALSVD